MSRRAKGLQLADTAFLGRVAGGSPFVPPSSANLKLWLKPDSLSALSDNDPVGTWVDSSGNGNDVTASGSIRPLYKTNQLNGNAGVQFDGVDDFLFSMNNFSNNTVYTMFMVLKFDSASGTEVPFRVGESKGYGMYKSSGNRTVLHRLVADCVNDAATTSAEYWSAVRTSAPLLSFFVNGSSHTVTNNTSNVLAPNDGAIYVGRFGGAGLYFAGKLFEILCYDTNLGTTDRQTVEAYLASKYAI